MRSLSLGFAAALTAGFAASAAAAPQALLVAVNGDVPLLCEGGECAADLSTICLQPDRDVPDYGTRYAVIRDQGANGSILVVGRDAAGGEVLLPRDTAFSLTAERAHLAVRVRVPEQVRERFALASLTVRVSGAVAIAPMARNQKEIDGDVDVAGVMRSLKPKAENVLARNIETLQSARITHEISNALPRLQPTLDGDHKAAWEEVRRSALKGVEQDVIPPGALENAYQSFRACLPIGTSEVRRQTGELHWDQYTFRDCVGEMHNGYMNQINQQYWKELDFGS